jgi:ABC-type dipeptide/oligopeptide/nickel transport system permease subunit
MLAVDPLVADEASEKASVLFPLTKRRTARNIVVKIAMLWIGLIFTAAITADILPIRSPLQMDFAAPERGPSLVHPLGTDVDGRDILARVIYGSRVSLTVAVAAPLLGLTVGSMLGLLAAYFGGLVRSLILGLMDGILAFPGFVLALALTTFLGPSVTNVALALGILSIPAFARIARANALPLLNREFVLAARTAGASDAYILIREVLPNIGTSLLTYALTVMSVMIVIEGGLSFLGVGVPPPTPSWGSMIAEGREALERAPFISAMPALAMFLTVLSFNLIGDYLRRRIEVREGAL